MSQGTITLAGAAQQYLDTVAQVQKTGLGTVETSYYPAIHALLTVLGQGGRPRRSALHSPRGIDGQFPDVALYEDHSNVLVLPIEVKGAHQDLGALAVSAQARKYAETFGGGHVLVTNLWGFALAEIDPASGALSERGRVELVSDASELGKKHPSLVKGAVEQLAGLLEAGCMTRAALTDPKLVARLLAYHGKQLISAIDSAGDPGDLLAPVITALRKGLDVELDQSLLVPTTVQTLLYGLFAAWLECPDPQGFEWVGTAYRLAMPVYADMVHAILSPKVVRRCDLPATLSAAARVLAWVDRDAFVAAFDGGAIEYFYEPFLAQFDPDLRDRLGVWYTPAQIAEYQVARVDHHLRVDLGIERGLADETVLVLDPACGTGTYLAAVLRHIYARELANGEPTWVAAHRAAEAARTRIIGFEILPAAYIVAHLNLGRLLARFGARLSEAERARIYLCNALTGWGGGGGSVPQTPLPDLEAELRAALEVKAHEPVLVVLGNPPYEGYSAAESKDEQALLRPWIEPLWREYGVRKHRLGDLYIRFWRVGIQRIADITGRGMVSFISNRKWLGGRSAPVMRHSMLTRFDSVVVDDLHGDVHEHVAGDESIFTTATATGIRVGTAIVTAIRKGPISPGSLAEVTGRDLYGTAKEKHAQLHQWATAADLAKAMNEAMKPRPVSRASWWRLTAAVTGEEGASLDDYLTYYVSGVQPIRDQAVTDTDRAVLEGRMRDYFDAKLSLEEVVKKHPGFGVTRARYNPARTRERLLKESTYSPELLVRYAFRPFDLRWLYWEPAAKLLNEARRELQTHWLNAPGQYAIVCPQTARRPGAPRPFVTAAVPCNEAADPNARVFPRLVVTRPAVVPVILDQKPEPEPEPELHTSVSAQWIAAARLVGISGTDDEVGDVVFHALIAVMNSPAWLDAQPVWQDDFPDIPLPANADELRRAAVLGQRLANLFDPDREVPGVTSGLIDPAWSEIGTPDAASGPVKLTAGRATRGGVWRESDGSLLWDTSGGGLGWRNVPPKVWDFSVAGFQVLPKYLGYRIGENLTPADRLHVMHLCRRIAAIREMEADCDGAYQAASTDPLTGAP